MWSLLDCGFCIVHFNRALVWAILIALLAQIEGVFLVCALRCKQCVFSLFFCMSPFLLPCVFSAIE